uniref:Retrovirus-related Pol polyprotein from transposon TNT 1-94 n=1 Tax=Cajanus cajan TaxID=3821 RepID=A0A151TS26_CAJCA|nr:hypothetical protein KK1_009073 [Cajanus cajan]
MEAHLEGNDLWEIVEEDYKVLPLTTNPTMAQIRNHKEKKARKSKVRASLFAVVSKEILTRIMTMKLAKIVAQSIAEIEFIAATTATNQALWLRKMLTDLHLEQKTATNLMVDNQAAIAIYL